jgi:hypothetical protein
VAERSNHTKPLVGEDDGKDTWPDAYLDARPAEGRTQVLRAGSFPYLTVRDATRTLDQAVTIHELTLWDGNDDTARTFRLPVGAFEVPAKADWATPWSYEATSTEGTTHLRVQSKVGDSRDIVHLEDGDAHTSYEAIRVDSVIDVSGDRTSHIERSVWWATDLGVPAQIREVERTTTSKGTAYSRTVTATLRQTTASPESLNRQVTPEAP